MSCQADESVSTPIAIRARRYAILSLLGIAAMAGCERSSPSAAKQPPATVATIAQEDQLNTIRLTPEAEQRLGIVTAPVELRKMARMRTYGAEITLPTGAAIIVSSPVGGTLQAPSKVVPKVGARLEIGHPIFLLLPLLSPERSVLTPAERIRFAEARNTVAQSQIDAAGQVEQVLVQVDAAKIALERAERLLREKAGAARAVDDAQAQLSLAMKALEAAEARKKLVDGIKLDEEAGTLQPLVIESPRQGILRAEHAAPGEVVAAGAPLFEVVDLDPIWVRVSVYAGELADLSTESSALVSDIADRDTMKRRQAAPIAAPPSATPLAAAVDLYYELSNADGTLRPGQRVTARLPLCDEAESPTVPWSAVVHDIQGGTWVYEQTAPHVFVRRRVQVRYVVDDRAVLDQGPALGAAIVTQGVVELFGTEFGFAK